MRYIRLQSLTLILMFGVLLGDGFAQTPSAPTAEVDATRVTPEAPLQTPPSPAPLQTPPAGANGATHVPTPQSLEQLEAVLQATEVGMPNLALAEGLMPPNPAGQVFTEASQTRTLAREDFQDAGYHWMASGVWSRPLYFEDVMLERHGHSRGHYTQPFISGGRFFGSVLILPYTMTLDPPHAHFSTLGHYRPGSVAPLVRQRPRWRNDAAAVQAATVTGAVLILP